ncbi:nucleotidyltransferase family protein [Streptococcus ictaluri]|uniref:Nucleotidyltransferase domain protein n=1 Tax=Streptococcus ictaluri 707-05 TaxID=764299 RepID=G5K4T4_9STRE|nr:nucleotidyltransferase domain-containing protein [Streptococcus ictaluri]EHI69242.1 nucleotidyltransferase domain protein [Streptococcus ictaluri 707-05]
MVYTIEEIKEKIQPIAEKYELPVVYLFGSYARNEADEDSDIDLAISVKNLDITGFELLDLEDEVKSQFNIPVDFLIVEDIEMGKSPIALQVKKNFEQEKVRLYETGTVRKRLLFS